MSQFRIRYSLIVVVLAVACVKSVRADDVLVSARETDKDGVAWYGAHDIGVEGQAWSDTESPFDRLPARAKEQVRAAVWGLSKQSAGLCVRFVIDATTIHARWTLTSARLEMNHMPATGVSGLDLYANTKTVDETGGKFRWLAVGRPTAKSNSVKLVSGIPKGSRE